MKPNLFHRWKLLLRSWRALFLYAFSDKEKAKKELQGCIELDPENGLNLRTLGKILVGEGNYIEGLEKLNDSLRYLKKTDRSLPEVYAYIAYCYYELGRLDESIQFYEKAIDSWVKDEDFKQIDLYYSLGRIYVNQRRFDQAIDIYKKALNLRQRNGLIHFGLGVAYYEIGKYQNSLQHLLTAIDLDPMLKDNETIKTLKKEIERKIPMH